jgi:hypothetical protein
MSDQADPSTRDVLYVEAKYDGTKQPSSSLASST